jgi:hypothetical protein
MNFCGSQDNLKRWVAEITFLCIGIHQRLHQKFHRNLFEIEMVTNCSGIFRNVCPGLWQAKAENVAAGGDGHILFRVDRVSHRGRADVLPGIKMP